MKKTNKKCCVCGCEYYFCSGCPSQSPSYMTSFCSENCKKIYHAVAGYNFGDLGEKEAYELLSECDLSKRENFTAATKSAIEEILKDAPKPVAILESENIEKATEKKTVKNEKRLPEKVVDELTEKLLEAEIKL